MIKVFVQKTMAQAVVDTPLTSGSKGMTVEFVFSEDWNGLEKTAVFETSSFYKETEQLTGETIEVPEDVMAWANETLYVGVYGTSQNGATVIPTVYADCGKIQKGANDSEGGRPLIPAQSDILQNQIDSLGDRVAWLEETGGGGGAGILLDTTLTQSGKAADAKAVGDALEQKQDAGNYLTDHNTFVGDVNTSSEAFYEAFSARKPCFLLRPDAGSGMVMWVAHDCTSRVARFYNVTPDGTVRYATLEGLVFSYESAAGGSGNVFVGDANTTVAEFYEAYQAGKVCFLKRASGPSGTVTWVSYNCTQYFAFFYHVTNGGAVMYAWLSEDGTWTTNRALSDVVKSVNGITPDPSGKVTLPIPTKPADIGAQPAGNYATKDEIPVVPAIPATLPNPHKLTFSGAVNAEYDGSAAVEVVIQQGGGGASEEVWEDVCDITIGADVYAQHILTAAEGKKYKKLEVCIANNQTKKARIVLSSSGEYGPPPDTYISSAGEIAYVLNWTPANTYGRWSMRPIADTFFECSFFCNAGAATAWGASNTKTYEPAWSDDSLTGVSENRWRRCYRGGGIDQISIYSTDNSMPITSGCRVIIKGVRF